MDCDGECESEKTRVCGGLGEVGAGARWALGLGFRFGVGFGFDVYDADPGREW